MKKIEFINVQGKTYSIIGIYGGQIYLGNPNDVNNGVIKEGIIWEMQPFYEKTSKTINFYYSFIRFFKIDVFGRSKFKNKLSSIKLF
jgi:hypothetical protein